MDDMKDDSILIVGTGALACLFAARLAPHSDITMLGTWPDGIRALQEYGVRLVEGESETAFPVRATSDPADCTESKLAIVLVKSWQTSRAAEQLSQCLHAGGMALTLQNGYGNLQKLQTILGFERAALGITTSGATLLGPGKVRPGGKGPIHVVPQPKLQSLIEKLINAGFDVEESDDLDSLVWGKLVINAGINPITALLQIPNGALLEQSDAHALMEAAALETAAVAEALGVRLPFDDPVQRVEQVANQTAQNHSSMYQDVLRGAPTEVEAISGAIVQEGERVGVPTPVNKVILHLIRAVVSEELRDAT
jgi:2-dehydropantoate 2-reductase